MRILEEEGRAFYDLVMALRALCDRVRYKDGWRFSVPREHLHVRMYLQDSRTGREMELSHVIPIPHALAYEVGQDDPVRRDRVLRRWLLERIFDIERHEACEFFTVDGHAPFFPPHPGPGSDELASPYTVRELPEGEWVPINRPERDPRREYRVQMWGTNFASSELI